MADSVKWSSDQLVTFLEIYRKHECLWDIRSPEYLKRDSKQQAFAKLLDELRLNGIIVTEDVLKKKIKNLRDAYRNELIKVKKSKKSGAGASEVYKPKLVWFVAADAFWNSVLSGRQSSSSMDWDTQSVAEDDNAGDEPENVDGLLIEQTATATSTAAPAPVLPVKRIASSMPPPGLRKKPFKPGSNSKYPTRFESSVDKLENIAMMVSPQETETVTDDQYYDRFAKHVGSQLRELPLRSFVLLQQEIQNLITRERLNQIDFTNQFTPSPAESSSSCDVYSPLQIQPYDNSNTSGLDLVQKALLEIGEMPKP
ncbi:uncharacterized protein LOC128984325 [Macrosteles quadrilineatus]|uniref:uncharacterized protein LOC128984325 n=1 Tax=Macrosteles quadrilineatus TaxID=74068 RepID=UPI0023E2A13F|nr:uncharacterized protein LOC128984325 [Macrosteles quadrilineatus]